VRTIEVSSEEEMAEKVDELCSKEFATTEKSPLFIMYRIKNVGTGRSAVLVRLHHAIGDGMALIGCMSHVFEDLQGNPFSLDIPKNAGGGTSRAFNLGTLWKFVTSAVFIAALPLTPYDTDIAFSTPDKPSLSMKGKKRRTVYFPVLNLEFVKELKRRANVTVNDVLLAATAGAIRRYCDLKKDPAFATSALAQKVQCRALMPVAFPRSQAELSNPSKVSPVTCVFVCLYVFMNKLNVARLELRACGRSWCSLFVSFLIHFTATPRLSLIVGNAQLLRDDLRAAAHGQGEPPGAPAELLRRHQGAQGLASRPAAAGRRMPHPLCQSRSFSTRYTGLLTFFSFLSCSLCSHSWCRTSCWRWLPTSS